MTDMTPLHIACKGGNKALVKLILDAAKAEMNSDEFLSFLNHTNTLRYELQEEKTALNYAVASQCTDIVLLLLEAGADPNVYNAEGGEHFPTALTRTVQLENIDMAKLLLDNGKCKADLSRN